MPWGWGKEFSIKSSLPLNGPVSLDKNPRSSHLEAVKFRTRRRSKWGVTALSTQTPLFLLSVYGATPRLHVAWWPQVQTVLGSAHPEAASASLLQRWKRGSLQAVWTGGREPGSQGSLGSLPSTSVSQVVISTDALKYQVPSNLGLSGVLQHKLT